MNAFGAPIQSDVAADSAGDPLDQVQEILDPNDPALVSEALDVNPDGDAYAFPPPPPDGRYRAKLKLLKTKINNEEVDTFPAKWGKKGTPQMVLVTAIDATIIDPSGKHDGQHVFERNVSTFIQGNGFSKVTTIVNMLRRPDGSKWNKPGEKLTSKGWMDLLVQALAGEPELGVETIWEWSCQKCGEEAKAKGEAYPRSVKGMNKFPQSKPGQYDAEMKCSVDPKHGFSRARVTVGRWLPVSELR